MRPVEVTGQIGQQDTELLRAEAGDRRSASEDAQPAKHFYPAARIHAPWPSSPGLTEADTLPEVALQRRSEASSPPARLLPPQRILRAGPVGGPSDRFGDVHRARCYPGQVGGNTTACR
uniref:Uncharacterized protein n=1 Tax=uncultured Armatimonadetes bacterium TaxID=157466 RepID=A0A6J4IYJ3_9BACT|nr:hypothetical protein AVDCRST_MAG63-2648 [uncultured Armatimonadetes bacterium]